jgi:hypothetical protein
VKHNDWKSCACGQKRDFMTRQNAEKALGRAKTHRSRRAGESRRGLRIEHRTYQCSEGGWHLTAESRAKYEGWVAA